MSGDVVVTEPASDSDIDNSLNLDAGKDLLAVPVTPIKSGSSSDPDDRSDEVDLGESSPAFSTSSLSPMLEVPTRTQSVTTQSPIKPVRQSRGHSPIGVVKKLLRPPRPGLARKKSAIRPREIPIPTLTIYFVLYKGLLLLLAYLGSRLGVYDTSSRLLSGRTLLQHWDTVWFGQIAQQGYFYEQQFAFGPLLPALTRYVHPIVIGLLGHYIAIIFFYKCSFFATSSERLALISSLLHIINPAGIFLCVGYTESVYCALTYFALSLLHKRNYVSAGLFGLSGLARSTGILNVLYFLPKRPEAPRLVKSAVLGGIVIFPWSATQLYAYYRFCLCSAPSSLSSAQWASVGWPRPWCDRSPPLVYSFVQDHYWDVGFGRYFTLSNLPLFLLAAPTYALLALSAELSISGVQQSLLAALTFTSAHAQIITRQQCAFPCMYWFLARKLVQRPDERRWRLFIGFWLAYGCIQAVLFGAYLPPA